MATRQLPGRDWDLRLIRCFYRAEGPRDNICDAVPAPHFLLFGDPVGRLHQFAENCLMR